MITKTVGSSKPPEITQPVITWNDHGPCKVLCELNLFVCHPMAKVSCQVKLLGLKLSFLVIANVRSSLKFQRVKSG